MMKVKMGDELFDYLVKRMDLKESMVKRLRKVYVGGVDVKDLVEIEKLSKQAVYKSIERFEGKMLDILRRENLALKLCLVSKVIE